MEIIFIIIVSFLVGWLSHASAIYKKIAADPDEMISLISKFKKIKDSTQQVQESPQLIQAREVKVEKHGDIIYVYAKDTDEFLAQGTDLQDALAQVEKRYPGKLFKGFLSKEEVDALGASIK